MSSSLWRCHRVLLRAPMPPSLSWARWHSGGGHCFSHQAQVTRRRLKPDVMLYGSLSIGNVRMPCQPIRQFSLSRSPFVSVAAAAVDASANVVPSQPTTQDPQAAVTDASTGVAPSEPTTQQSTPESSLPEACVVDKPISGQDLDFVVPEKPEAAISFVSESGKMFDLPFDQIGLASWWPPGRFQYLMEQLHVGLDMPWWAAISAVTLALRLITFPLVVKAQHNLVKMQNLGPQMEKLQSRITESKIRGDKYEVLIATRDYQNLLNQNQIKPLSNALPSLCQGLIFVSMFMALRGMTNLPVFSLQEGGLGWFSDLSRPDPYCILPISTSLSLFLQIQLGADGIQLQRLGRIGKIMINFLPILLLPFSMNFPAAITLYWFISNIISICQARLLRIEKIRRKLNLPERKIHRKKNKTASFSPSNMVSGTKQFWSDLKKKPDVSAREADEERFRMAGRSQIQPTFRFDPTKPRL